MDDRAHRLVAERERVAAHLAKVDGVTVFPSGANFLLFRPAGDGHVLWERLVGQGVLVRDFSRWPRLDDCLRVTIGTPAENDTFLDALRASLQEVAAW
jgi:histidinol-phosphate aminotransferase